MTRLTPLLRSLALPLLLAALHAPPATADTVYRLDEHATFQAGCFDPCDCPLADVLEARGVFLLGPARPGDAWDFFRVSQVHWTVGFGDRTLHTITGSGTYQVTNFGDERQHMLELDLSIDGRPARHFFSDAQPFDGTLRHIDLTVSLNGVHCNDVVIRVSAGAVPRDEIVRYRLGERSTYQNACFDPCDCVSEEPRPLRGGFGLVKLLDLGNWAEYAVIGAHFATPSLNDELMRLSGSGRYTLIQGFAGPLDGMTLRLTGGGDGVRVFDQEVANTDTLFPDIDVVLDMNEMVCTDTVLTLRARPISRP